MLLINLQRTEKIGTQTKFQIFRWEQQQWNRPIANLPLRCNKKNLVAKWNFFWCIVTDGLLPSVAFLPNRLMLSMDAGLVIQRCCPAILISRLVTIHVQISNYANCIAMKKITLTPKDRTVQVQKLIFWLLIV